MLKTQSLLKKEQQLIIMSFSTIRLENMRDNSKMQILAKLCKTYISTILIKNKLIQKVNKLLFKMKLNLMQKDHLIYQLMQKLNFWKSLKVLK